LKEGRKEKKIAQVRDCVSIVFRYLDLINKVFVCLRRRLMISCTAVIRIHIKHDKVATTVA